MNTQLRYFLATSILFFMFVSLCLSQNKVGNYIVLSGEVVGQDTKKPLTKASVTLKNTNIATMTNDDGHFQIRIPEKNAGTNLIIKYLGYENKEIAISSLIKNENNTIVLRSSSILLNGIEILSGNGADFIEKAIRNIPKNYSKDPNMMVAFYRETITKNNNYISLVEAVVDVYKSSYSSSSDDLARIYIGRKATDIGRKDTLLLKFQGGISTSLMVDVAKNPQIIFGERGEEYNFRIQGLIYVNDKPNYIISFDPKYASDDLTFRGTIYLDKQTLAFNRIEFNTNVENNPDAASRFIRRKPAKMKATMLNVSYFIDYIEKEGKWYFNYSKTDVGFKIRWTNRFFGLISTTYHVTSELAITDRYTDDVVKFPRDERIKSTDIIAEKVENFQDPEFWGEYNVIAPDVDINKAIQRMSSKLKKREK